MSLEGQNFYPGERATAHEIACLAIEYDRAAEMLLRSGRRGQPLSWAPYRLVALHAVELYLNAFLVSAGYSQATLRRHHHNLAVRARMAIEAGLSLRQDTVVHLRMVEVAREYLVARYEPGEYKGSELTRLSATFREVADKVTRALDRRASRRS